VNTILFLQAKVEAVKWVLSLTANLEFKVIVIELDSHICDNLLSDLEYAPPWRIKSIYDDSRVLLAFSPKFSVY